VTEEGLLERVDVLAPLAWGSKRISRECVAYAGRWTAPIQQLSRARVAPGA
jgi:hypothetical protein